MAATTTTVQIATRFTWFPLASTPPMMTAASPGMMKPRKMAASAKTKRPTTT